MNLALRAALVLERATVDFPPGVRRQALGWVALAKRPETRQRRIATIFKAAAGERP